MWSLFPCKISDQFHEVACKVGIWLNLFLLSPENVFNYYLEHMFVGKHYGKYLCLKKEIIMKIGKILKLHRISELMPPTAFFYLDSFRKDK